MKINKILTMWSMLLLISSMFGVIGSVDAVQNMTNQTPSLNSDTQTVLQGSTTEAISGTEYYYSVTRSGGGRYDDFHITTNGASSIVATIVGETMESNDDIDLYYKYNTKVSSCSSTICTSYSQASTSATNNEIIEVSITQDGTHWFRIQRYSGSGQDYYTFRVDVISGPVDTTAPTVAITAPLSDSTVSDTVSVTAMASDNIGVDRVEFRIDGTLKLTDTSSPYSFNWDTTTVTNGLHTVEASAFDAAGNSDVDSISVTTDNIIIIPSGCDETPRVTGSYPWWHDSIDAEKAHAAGCYGGDSVVVVLDTGLGSGYTSLFPAGSVLTQYSHSYTQSGGYDNVNWNQDTEGHGTSVTGTILGYYVPSSWGFTNNYAMGIAPNADIIMNRVVFWVGAGVSYAQMVQSWVDAINDAITLHNGALAGRGMIISMSLGYDPSAAPSSSNTALENAISNARANGIIVSTSAGNDGPSPNTTGNPANFDASSSIAAAGWSGLTGSYGVAGILTDIPEDDFSGLLIADFSSRGKVEVTGIGWQIVLPSSDNNYYYISGTSFSCPQMSGVFAVMYGFYGLVSPDTIESTAMNSAYNGPNGSGGSMSASTWGGGFVQVDAAIGL